MSNHNNPSSNNDFNPEVYKKWRRSKTDGGFLAVQYWYDARRVIIDIGSVDGQGSLRGNAFYYLSDIDFLAYLRAEISGNSSRIYPEIASEKGLVFFGGGNDKESGQLIARVFKIKLWNNDPTARLYECSWFVGEAQDQGAIKPIYDKKLRHEFIKMTLPEIAQLFESLSLEVYSSKIGHSE